MPPIALSPRVEPDPDYDAIVKAWVQQLLSDDLLRAAVERGGQVEIRLFSNRGMVRKDPVIVLNNGPSPMV